MNARQTLAKGFTLVEILIVVVILGILAAIVIPQFTNASETAKASSLVSQLQTLRSQLELYQVQHNGIYPSSTSATFWEQLTRKTNLAGATVAADAPGAFGPYIQKPIVNPFTTGGNGSVVGAAASANVGWVYAEDTATGNWTIRASLDGAKATALGLTSADVAPYGGGTVPDPEDGE